MYMLFKNVQSSFKIALISRLIGWFDSMELTCLSSGVQWDQNKNDFALRGTIQATGQYTNILHIFSLAYVAVVFVKMCMCLCVFSC